MLTRWVICLMLLVASGSANSADLVGQASIIDGNTLEIHGSRIRLWGIDAPESSQLCRGDDSLQYRCGAKAANDLDAFIAGRPVNCLPISLDRYGRTVATCSVGGADLGDFGYIWRHPRVTSWRPRGSGIGSSNGRFQPRSAMSELDGVEAVHEPNLELIHFRSPLLKF